MPTTSVRQVKLVVSALLLLTAVCTRTAEASPVLLKSSLPQSHISSFFTLYGGVLRILPNGDLAIAVPRTEGMYKIRFYDDKVLLFEIRQIRDSLLIVEKYNFQHAGIFRYELFLNNTLVEKKEFTLKRDKYE